MTDPVLRVQMLGGFSLQLDDRPVPPVASRTATSLLAFLILRRERPQTRDVLAGRFWSDLAETTARRRLSNALWLIRRSVRSVADVDLLTVTSTTITVNRSLTVQVDVEQFEQRLDELEALYRTNRRGVDIGELTAVVDSYQGDLLDGHYDEWIDDQRQKVRERWLQALGNLVQMNTGEGAYEAALRHGRALVAAEPLSEERHREVMRLYALNGQPSAAERQYAQCRDMLFTELAGAEPSAETNALLERIRREAASPSAIAVGADNAPLPFIGRSAERSALLGRVNELVAGKGGVVLIEGEPGIGKSRLLEEVIQGAEWRGVQVLVGHHVATSSLSPYEAIRELLAPAVKGIRGERLAGTVQAQWLAPASKVLGELRAWVEPGVNPPWRPEEERWRTAEALAQVILGLGRAKPALLVLEDVHWCDEDTMQVLVQLGHWLIDSGILLCLSYQRHEAQRSPAVWAGLSELEAKPGASRHVIPPLDEEEVRQLVTAELGPGRMAGPAVAQLARTTLGNPYLIIELLRSPLESLDADVFALPRSGAEGASDGDLVLRVMEVVGRRLLTVPDDVRAVLEAVSAMTGPATTNAVVGVVGLDRATVVSALAEAVDSGFLAETERGFEFAQEQMRRAVYDAVEPDLRRRVHGRIVDALVGQSGVSVAQLAHHAWLAQQWPRAHQYHSMAADSALKVHAYHTAVEHFAKADHAAGQAGMGDRSRADDLFAYERVLDILGRRGEQQAMLERLGEVALDPATALAVGQRQAWLLAQTDRGTEAARLALESMGPARAAGLPVGELLNIVGHARFWSGDMHGAIGPLREAVEELQKEKASVVSPLLILGRSHADLQQYDPAQRYLEEALALAKAENDARSQVEALGHLATLHHALRLDVKAENAFLEALELARSIGYRHGEGLNLVNLATFHLVLGRGGRAVGLFAEASAVFASLGNGRGEAYVKLNAAELAHWVLGDDGAARAQAEQAAVFFRWIKDQRREAYCLVILASIDRRQGRRRLARRRLGDAIDKARLTDDPTTETLARFNLALVELELAHHQEALDELARANAVARESDVDDLGPVLMATEARALAGLGRLEAAAEMATRAIGFNRPGATLAHLAAWWCSEVLAQAGQESMAAEQVAFAHQLVARNLEGLPETTVRSVWDEVAEYRAILDTRERYFVEQIECRLPRADVPTGRPLEAADLVDVTWTMSSPDDWSVHPAVSRRQARVLRLAAQAVEQGALARVSDLAQALGVSERTIKRDLGQLRQEGHRPLTRGSGE